jgi:cytochrome c oxidase subunit 2
LLSSCGSKSGPDNEQNALRPAGPYADQILDLTRPFFWIAVVVGIGVLAATIYVALRFRVKPGDDKMPKQTHGNTVLEVSWTIIPALILAVMAVPTVAVIFDLAERPTGPEVVNVTVTARQWWWQFSYDDNENLQTANELHIPAGRPVALTLVGPPACVGENCYDNGVLHSFWIPELNGKKDVVPGRRQFLKLFADKPGTYRGQCAELCGKEHGFMPIVVEVKSKEDYAAWRDEQKKKGAAVAVNPNKVWELADLVSHGQTVFNANCAACHQPTGAGNTAIGAPALVGDKVVLGPKDHQIDVVLNGQNNGKMPPWKGVLSDVDIASAITYTRNSWGNKAQENVVQPSEVKAARK